MIYTRFGLAVTIIKGDIKKGEVDIRYKENGRVRETTISFLRADNGIKEIQESIESANEGTLPLK